MWQKHGTSSNTALSANMLAVPPWTTHGLLRSFLLSVCSVGPTPVHECPYSESLLSDCQSGSTRKTKTQPHDLYGSRVERAGVRSKSQHSCCTRLFAKALGYTCACCVKKRFPATPVS